MGRRVDSYRMPQGEDARAELAVTIGRDGFHLLEAVVSPDAPAWLREIPAVQVLRTAWEQYHRTITDTAGTEVAWRENKDLPPGRARLPSRMTSTPATGSNAGPDGPATKFTSPRPAMTPRPATTPGTLALPM
jgi:hypothetical protein